MNVELNVPPPVNVTEPLVRLAVVKPVTAPPALRVPPLTASVDPPAIVPVVVREPPAEIALRAVQTTFANPEAVEDTISVVQVRFLPLPAQVPLVKVTVEFDVKFDCCV